MVDTVAARLLANGTFRTGSYELDEINGTVFSIDTNNQKVYANTFDEVTQNSSIGYNYYSSTTSRDMGMWVDSSGCSQTTKGTILNPLGELVTVPYFQSTVGTNTPHWIADGVFVGTAASLSIFAKADTVRYFALILDNQADAGFFVVCDALTGNILRGQNNSTTTVIDIESKYYGNGWWRFSVSGKIRPDSSLDRLSINLLASFVSSWYTSSVITIGNGLWLTFLQLEERPFTSTLKLDSQTPFGNTPMRLESTNELFVRNQFDEVNVVI